MRLKRQQAESKTPLQTSWEVAENWYRTVVGKDGHYYHKQIVIPGVLKLMALESAVKPISLIDLACGPGVLSRHLPEHVGYTGIDLSPGLIKEAKREMIFAHHQFLIGDVTKPLPGLAKAFTHAVCMLALQNIQNPQLALKQISQYLQAGGQLVLVLNHPCFRIPRQTSWQIDAEKKIQFRRIDRYATTMQIPMQMHPSQGEQSPNTWTFHHSLTAFSTWLYEAGFMIERLEEWYSDKVSTGSAAKMENRSRQEFPLFLALKCHLKP